MGAESEDAAGWEFVAGCGDEVVCKHVEVTGDLQWVGGRAAASHLFADVFFEIDDVAANLHGRDVAQGWEAGE